MAVINTNIKLPTGGTKKNNEPTTPPGAGTLQSLTGNTGGVYRTVLKPNDTAPAPIYAPVLEATVQPVSTSKYFNSSAVGTTGAGSNTSNPGTDGSGTTYGDVIGKPKQYSAGNGENGSVKVYGDYFEQETGTDGGSGEQTGGDTPTPTPNPTVTDSTMTYAEYIASEKEREEQERQQAYKDAEIYKERAAADAQASYLQNMSTYGINAENMAKMGLTGGGYSDYLNAQAYAQKRGDLQKADANEIAMKKQADSVYREGIAALNKDLMNYQEQQEQNKKTTYNSLLGYAIDADSGLTEDTIRSMGKSAGLSEEEMQNIINTWNTTQANAEAEKTKAKEEETAKAKQDFTVALTAEIQNPNTYSNYTEAGLRALLKAKGYYTDEEIQGFVDIWNDTKKNAELSLDGENPNVESETPINIDDEIKAIQNGLYVDESGTPYSWDYIHGLLLQARNAGENITEEDINRAKSAYDTWLAYRNGNLSTKEYYDALNGDTTAQGIVNAVVSPEEIKAIAEKYGFTSDVIGDIVDTSRDNVSWDIFGKYQGNKKQKDYANAIIADAKAGKIKEGQVVKLNFGTVAGDAGYFLYAGGGKFVKLKESPKTLNTIGNRKENLYVPKGYKVNWNGNIRKS